jgi:hypothetical protein
MMAIKREDKRNDKLLLEESDLSLFYYNNNILIA